MPTSPRQRRKLVLRQRAFLEAYRLYGTVLQACHIARVARSEHYRWLKRPRYAKRFHEAEEQAIEQLESEARRRALIGVERQVFYKGQVVGTQVEYSDRLLEFKLKAKRPTVYRDRAVDRGSAATGTHPDDARLLTRLRRETLEQALAELTDAGDAPADADPRDDSR